MKAFEKRIAGFCFLSLWILTAGCANYGKEKMLEWEQAYRQGELSYYEKEHLMLMQRHGGRIPAHYYFRSGAYFGPSPIVREEI